MDKRSAAGLRRSAIAERLRLREEWSALKGISEDTAEKPAKKNPKKRQQSENQRANLKSELRNNNPKEPLRNKYKSAANKENCPNGFAKDSLHGIVVFVDVGNEPRALALRAALAALGATVVPSWSPIVTHLVWSQGGCRDTRARARALACNVVSPLWVEACAAAARMLPESVFPAPPRASDLPSPRTLNKLLKKAEQDNVTFANLLSDSEDSGGVKRWRISSDTEGDSTRTTDTSADTSHDRSRDKSAGESRDSPDVRVNTALRRVRPVSTSPEPAAKSRRKLFTQLEPDATANEESEADVTPVLKKTTKMTQREKRELIQAERMARRLVTPAPAERRTRHTDSHLRFVLTGMSRTERKIITRAIRHLNGLVQRAVDKKTDTVILGSCSTQCPEVLLSEMLTSQLNINKSNENLPPYTGTTTVGRIQKGKVNISGVHELNTKKNLSTKPVQCNQTENLNTMMSNQKVIRDQENMLILNLESDSTRPNISGVTNKKNFASEVDKESGVGRFDREVSSNVNERDITEPEHTINNLTAICNSSQCLDKPRTVNALLGAIRGCRVLNVSWVVDSIKANGWLHHFGYEVKQLLKISQKARVERSALGLMKKEYSFNVFRGMRVRVSEDAEQREAILHLLSLCGAVVTDTGNGLEGASDADVTIGLGEGDICSKWVFDSVAAARMRTTRRYVNKIVPDCI